MPDQTVPLREALRRAVEELMTAQNSLIAHQRPRPVHYERLYRAQRRVNTLIEQIPMPRCETCIHWDQDGQHEQGRSGESRRCDCLSLTRDYPFDADNSEVYTDKTFGCALYEALEQIPIDLEAREKETE